LNDKFRADVENKKEERVRRVDAFLNKDKVERAQFSTLKNQPIKVKVKAISRL